MDTEARSAMTAMLAGTAYSYLHGVKEIPFAEIREDLNAIIRCGLESQDWFVSVHSMYHVVNGVEYYDIGIMTTGEPIGVRAVLDDGKLKASLH